MVVGRDVSFKMRWGQVPLSQKSHSSWGKHKKTHFWVETAFNLWSQNRFHSSHGIDESGGKGKTLNLQLQRHFNSTPRSHREARLLSALSRRVMCVLLTPACHHIVWRQIIFYHVKTPSVYPHKHSFHINEYTQEDHTHARAHTADRAYEYICWCTKRTDHIEWDTVTHTDTRIHALKQLF